MKFILLRENYQKAKKILKDLELDIDDPDFKEVAKLVGKHRGYLGKFTEWHFNQDISIDYLKNLLDQILEVGLKKPIDSFKTAEDLGDYLTKSKYERKTKQVIKSLPSRSRKLVSDKLINLIFNFPQHIPSVRDFYSKKGGRYNDSTKLYNDTENLIKNLEGGWDVDSIDYDSDELVYKDSSTLILHITNYDRSCQLGSQHWCISTREDDWDVYTSNFNKQYFIYDFSKSPSEKQSMIGATIKSNGTIEAAHYRDDTELEDNSKLSLYSEYLKPYNKEYIKSRIDIDDIEKVSKHGLVGEVDRLIDQGVDPSSSNNEVIKLASLNGHIDVVNRLLEDERVDPGDGDNYAIRWASDNGHIEVVNRLLEDGRVDPSSENNQAIKWASDNGHIDVVNRLLEDSRVDPSDGDNFAIGIASDNGHIDVVNRLLEDSRVDPSGCNNYAIRSASYNGHIEVVNSLLEDSRVDPSADDNYAIRSASEMGHINVVNRLLEDSRVDPSAEDNEAIRSASEMGDIEVVNRLLKDGRVDPSAKDNDAIKLASYYNRIKVFNRLLEDDRVDPSADNNYAIQWASQRGNFDIVKLLLSDSRVKNSLSNKELKKYENMI